MRAKKPPNAKSITADSDSIRAPASRPPGRRKPPNRRKVDANRRLGRDVGSWASSVQPSPRHAKRTMSAKSIPADGDSVGESSSRPPGRQEASNSRKDDANRRLGGAGGWAVLVELPVKESMSARSAPVDADSIGEVLSRPPDRRRPPSRRKGDANLCLRSDAMA